MLLTIQLLYGAFMAGTHAALYAPTWPDMNGIFLPSVNSGGHTVLRSLCYDPLIIQFIHRLLAYFITLAIFIWYFKVSKLKISGALNRWRLIPLLLVLAQVTLGIIALINSGSKVFIISSVAHQLTGMLLFLCLIITLYLSKNRKLYLPASV
jgi:cytochrome c oxidase assembly protein subunit 15